MFEVLMDSESAQLKWCSYTTLLSSIIFCYILARKRDHLLFKDAIVAVYLGFFKTRLSFRIVFLIKGTKYVKAQFQTDACLSSARAHPPLL